MFSISTSWNYKYHTNGADMIAELKELGFETVELNFSLTPEMLAGAEELFRKGLIDISSVHNFCPIPEGTQLDDRKMVSPDYYNLASLDEAERQKAVHFTKITIDTASRLKASVAVLHIGRVDMADMTVELKELYNNGKRDSKEYRDILARAMEERHGAEDFLNKVLQSLDELEKYASEKGVRLGIENRYYIKEIPSFDEIGIILQRFEGRNIGYWHDAGHAQFWENLGIAKHKDFLERYSQRMIGMHLHDVQGVEDHKAPLTGKMDFSILKPYIREGLLKVIEAHQPAAAEEIKKGVRYLTELFGE